MSKLFYVPIEPLEERYTAQWYVNFPIAFKEAGFEVEVIDGVPLSDFVGVGTFLDINSTVAYKSTQMQKIGQLFASGAIKNGDCFFIGDTEFWGIEVLRLLAQMNKINVKIFSFLHAGSYTIEDAIEVAAPYQKYTELGWIASMDGVFVGSEYHKQAFIARRIKPFATSADVESLSAKIIVTGNPLFKSDYPTAAAPKQNKIIISNRFDWEKRPNISLQFAYLAKKKHPDWEIVVTTSRPKFKSNQQWLVDLARGMEADGIITIKSGLTKAEYHHELATSKIMLSNSIEENFGYCIVEALVYNTYPLLPNKLSHPELVQNNSVMLFDSDDEILFKMEHLMDSSFDVTHMVDRYFDSQNRIAKIIKEMV